MLSGTGRPAFPRIAADRALFLARRIEGTLLTIAVPSEAIMSSRS